MIKQIHRMMNRRGFTLVELVVVVAIIGVLSAILVPTLIGVVTKATVTSANQTASDIRTQANAFMISAEVSGFCMFQSADAVEIFNITVNNKTWECSSASDPNNFKQVTDVRWGRGEAQSQYVAGDDTGAITSGEKYLCVWISRNYPETKNASITLVFKSGVCTFVAYSTNKNTALASSEIPTITDGVPAETFAWDGKTSGVSGSGLIIGTSPVVKIA